MNKEEVLFSKERSERKGRVVRAFEENLQMLTKEVRQKGATSFYTKTLKPLARMLVGEKRKALDSQVLENHSAESVKPVLLILPGATEGREEYLPELLLFKDTHRVVIPDIPTLDPYHIPQEVHTLLHELHVAPTTPIDIYGASIGGPMAQQFQEAFPQQVRSLTFSHSAPENFSSWEKMTEGLLPLTEKNFLKIPWSTLFRHIHQRVSDSRFFAHYRERAEHSSENAVLRDLYRLAAADHHRYMTKQEAYVYIAGVLATIKHGIGPAAIRNRDTSHLYNVTIIDSPKDMVTRGKDARNPTLQDWQAVYPLAHYNNTAQKILATSPYGHKSTVHRASAILRALAQELDTV